MALPEHLDYEKYLDQDEWSPLVRCTIPGCTWNYWATWAELGNDEFAGNWAQLHPVHDPKHLFVNCWCGHSWDFTAS